MIAPGLATNDSSAISAMTCPRREMLIHQGVDVQEVGARVGKQKADSLALLTICLARHLELLVAVCGCSRYCCLQVREYSVWLSKYILGIINITSL